VNEFRTQIARQWYEALRRCSQRNLLTWDRTNHILLRWLPAPHPAACGSTRFRTCALDGPYCDNNRGWSGESVDCGAEKGRRAAALGVVDLGGGVFGDEAGRRMFGASGGQHDDVRVASVLAQLLGADVSG